MSDAVVIENPVVDESVTKVESEEKSPKKKMGKAKSTKTKATPKAKAVVSTKKTTKHVSDLHPKYSQMINEAIIALKDRNGSSRQAILKYIVANYNVLSDEKQVNNHIKMSLRAGVKSGKLRQSKGSGACGSYKLGEKLTEKSSKSKSTKSKSPSKKANLTKVKKPVERSTAKKTPSKKASAEKSSSKSTPKKVKASPKKVKSSPKKTPSKSPKKLKQKKSIKSPKKSKKTKSETVTTGSDSQAAVSE